LLELKSIAVEKEFASAQDTDGETLIPPTLLDFANLFRSDLLSLGVDLPVSTSTAPSAEGGILLLTLVGSDGFVDAAGRQTSEAYALNVSSEGITISGASPLGVWWGTRSLLQQIALGHTSIPLGFGIDSPGWGTRGIMVRFHESLE
jgi:hexosaminidase